MPRRFGKNSNGNYKSSATLTIDGFLSYENLFTKDRLNGLAINAQSRRFQKRGRKTRPRHGRWKLKRNSTVQNVEITICRLR
jgi:hypothetical protein